MSAENVERLRRAIEAYNAREIERFIRHCDPAVEFESAFAAVGGAIYHGHDGVRRYWHDLEDAWGGEIHVEPEAYFDLGERVLVFYVLHGRGRQSGVAVAMPVALITTWSNGLIVYLKAYAHREDALSALGASEDELAPIAP